MMMVINGNLLVTIFMKNVTLSLITLNFYHPITEKSALLVIVRES
jgi:hypothetical protein